MPKQANKEKKKVDRNTPIAREYTINLHKRLHSITVHKRAPRAVREIKKFAAAAMGTKDVRIGTDVNQFLWSKGIRHVPRRIRVRLAKKRSEDQDSEQEFYTLVSHIPVTSFKTLLTKVALQDKE